MLLENSSRASSVRSLRAGGWNDPEPKASRFVDPLTVRVAAREVSQRGGGARRGSVSERGIRLAVEPLWASREPVRWKRRSRTSGSDGWRQGRACVARQRRRNDTAQRPLAVTVTEGGGSPAVGQDRE